MPLTHNDDKIWFDEKTKLEQIVNDVFTAHSMGQSVLVLSHFDSTLTTLSSLLSAKGIPYESFASPDSAELCASPPPGKTWLASTRAFRADAMSSGAGNTILIIVAEHHPLLSRDQQILDSAANLGCEAQVCFYFSLDDPVMKYFGVGQIKALFERLGIAKDECISHHLVTTAIRSAQEKIEGQVGKDVATHSAEDWFRYNLRQKV